MQPCLKNKRLLGTIVDFHLYCDLSQFFQRIQNGLRNCSKPGPLVSCHQTNGAQSVCNLSLTYDIKPPSPAYAVSSRSLHRLLKKKSLHSKVQSNNHCHYRASLAPWVAPVPSSSQLLAQPTARPSLQLASLPLVYSALSGSFKTRMYSVEYGSGQF